MIRICLWFTAYKYLIDVHKWGIDGKLPEPQGEITGDPAPLASSIICII